MLYIISPKTRCKERDYIYNVIFSEFLGLEYTVEYADDTDRIIVRGNKGVLEIADVFFAIKKGMWLKEDSLPNVPLSRLEYFCVGRKIEVYNLPILYGRVNTLGEYIHEEDNQIYLGIDVVGSAFFVITRYEEYVVNIRDEHDRFPVKESIAFKEGFLDRPVVNEYVELLWCLLQKIAKGLERKKRHYKVIPTHDIDKPFGMMYDLPLQIVRHFAGDLLYRKSIKAFRDRLIDIGRLIFKRKEYIDEKVKTFEFILTQSKKHDLKDVFFFMNSQKSWYDGNYTVDEPSVLVLIKHLVSAGHYVGLHPSFDSYDDLQEIISEVLSMNKVLEKEGLPKLVGARQHYLKWKNPDTWQHYEDAGIPFDSTMTFAGYVGFRSGTCYPYPVFNLKTRTRLNLIERPLIVMDTTLYEYMKLSHPEAMKVVKKLADECRKYNGDFVILWHNTTLDNRNEQKFYALMLNEVCSEAVE